MNKMSHDHLTSVKSLFINYVLNCNFALTGNFFRLAGPMSGEKIRTFATPVAGTISVSQ